MSVEEDAELKNLVAQTLENKGILPKIRAELRANVFLALEENPQTKETLLSNDELSEFVKFPIGTLILNLIREFLEFFELEFTLSVFDPETKYGKEYISISKDKMMRDLKITECKKKNPLLYEVIERVINDNELKLSNIEKSPGDNSQVDMSGSGDNGSLATSPVGLNSTYVKSKSEGEFKPVSCEEEVKDDDESIKEELMSNNFSESESVADSKLNLGNSPRFEETVNGDSKDSKSNSPTPKAPIEIDLLMFTPVKEAKPKDKMRSSSLTDVYEKTNEIKDSSKSMSALGDLPPLTPVKSDEKGDKMHEIKAIIDKWPGLENEDELSLGSKGSKDQLEDTSPSHLKSDRSELTQKTDKSGEDLEEDISDLLNGHTPSDNQLTVDETVSEASVGADYLESL